MNRTELHTRINEAVSAFWETKREQLSSSGDSSNRGAVTAGKQLDGFIALLKDIAIQQGVSEECIYVNQAYLPGYFRSSKNWDFLIVTPKKKLAVAIELKSQVGSYSNNFNNRTEEAVGSAVDLWTAFREKQFPSQQAPWIGYLTVVGQDEASTSPVKNYEPYFPVRPEFNSASYLDRYRNLCQKLVLERHYSAAALVCTKGPGHYAKMSDDTSIEVFINSFRGYLTGIADEF